jgi:hypothetical protein
MITDSDRILTTYEHLYALIKSVRIAEKLCCERSTLPRQCWPSGCDQENAAAALSDRNDGQQSFSAIYQ